MYDPSPLRAANDRFWQLIRAELLEGPQTLLRDGGLWDHWLSPELVLSQTCGYPYRAHLHKQVTLIGTPDYGLPGCPAGYYNSVFVVRRDGNRGDLAEYADSVFAYNEPMSQSGWAAPVHHLAQMGFSFRTCIQTGAHSASVCAVSDGRADIAAIDALTWKLLCQHYNADDRLIELERTDPTPALPYISAQGRDRRKLFQAIERAIGELETDFGNLLCIKGIVDIEGAKYLAVPTPPEPDNLVM